MWNLKFNLNLDFNFWTLNFTKSINNKTFQIHGKYNKKSKQKRMIKIRHTEQTKKSCHKFQLHERHKDLIKKIHVVYVHTQLELIILLARPWWTTWFVCDSMWPTEFKLGHPSMKSVRLVQNASFLNVCFFVICYQTLILIGGDYDIHEWVFYVCHLWFI